MARAARSRGQGGRITESTATLPRLDSPVELEFVLLILDNDVRIPLVTVI